MGGDPVTLSEFVVGGEHDGQGRSRSDSSRDAFAFPQLGTPENPEDSAGTTILLQRGPHSKRLTLNELTLMD